MRGMRRLDVGLDRTLLPDFLACVLSTSLFNSQRNRLGVTIGETVRRQSFTTP